MIAKRFRFHGYNSLSLVYRRGHTVRSGGLLVKVIHNTKQKNFRIAVVVSRKISKSAVVRNRLRRRIYEIVQNQKDRIAVPYDIVVTVMGEQVIDMPKPELERTAIQLLKQAGALSAEQRDMINTKEK